MSSSSAPARPAASSPVGSARIPTSRCSCWRPVRTIRPSSRCRRTSAAPGRSEGWTTTGATSRQASSRPRRPSRASASRPRASCPFRAARSSAAPRPSTAAMRCAPTAATSTAGSGWATTTGRGTRSCPTSGARRTTPPAATGTAPAARCRSAASPARACARSCARSWTVARRPVTRSSRISTRRVPWERGRCPSTRSMAYGRARRSRYLAPARRRPNLEIRAGVTVDRVELIGGRARAVVLTSGERIDADVIVLARARSGARRSCSAPASGRPGSSSASASRSCTTWRASVATCATTRCSIRPGRRIPTPSGRSRLRCRRSWRAAPPVHTFRIRSI